MPYKLPVNYSSWRAHRGLPARNPDAKQKQESRAGGRELRPADSHALFVTRDASKKLVVSGSKGETMIYRHADASLFFAALAKKTFLSDILRKSRDKK